jgi:predicted RNase H-like HicB family nuclease
MRLTAVFQKVRNGYIGFVEELPGANTQARTLKEARVNLAEAVELVLDANRSMSRRGQVRALNAAPGSTCKRLRRRPGVVKA